MMKTHVLGIYKAFLVLVVIMFFGCMSGPGDASKKDTSPSPANFEVTKAVADNKPDQPEPESHRYKVTFIELGSVRCIPCQMMQPIMKSIEEKYEDQVKVIFYDVWTQEGRPFADQYNIQVIPTQVFLDKNGKEFFRHEGYFPEEELLKELQSQGIK